MDDIILHEKINCSSKMHDRNNPKHYMASAVGTCKPSLYTTSFPIHNVTPSSRSAPEMKGALVTSVLAAEGASAASAIAFRHCIAEAPAGKKDRAAG
jgi:hypothetical protein